jgi:Flp pilus assembly protein TadG
MRTSVRRFSRDERGNVLMMFGLAAIPLMGIVGASVDYGLALNRQTDLQVALDQATLIVARNPPAGDAEILNAKVKDLMTPQLAANGVGPTEWRLLQATDVNNRVTIRAESTLDTKFMSLIKVSTMTVAASSQVARNKKLELALVLDNTGSMELFGNRMQTLRTAATTLINKLYAEPKAVNLVKVALVPFITGVNIKADTGFDMAWIDQNAKAKYHGVNFNLVGGERANHLTLFNDLKLSDTSNPKVDWKGCVEARAEPYDVEDTTPDPQNPDTLFVPYFWPDEPDSGIDYNGGTSYVNRYIGDDYTPPQGVSNKTTAAARQKNVTKYKKTHGAFDTVPRDTTGPNKGCGDPLTPLTNNADLMRTRINGMEAWDIAGTNVAQGMMWGWSVLSPTAPFTEGVAYTDEGTQKAMIVLTDGENNVTTASNHNRSHFSSYGYLVGGRFGTTDPDDAIDAIDAKVKTLCSKIKNKNIRLYTITFQLNDANAQKMYRDCATSPSMYYNSPTTAELESIFAKIADDLGNLHISR